MDRVELRAALERFHARMVEYRDLLVRRKYEEAEALRSDLNIGYGELRDGLHDLEVPSRLQMSGRTFPIFETALQRFDPNFGFPIGRAVDSAIQSLETAFGVLKGGQPKPDGTAPSRVDNKVFLVHGHEHATRDMVARFLEGIGADPIILSEKAGKSRTLIEKLEQEGLEAGFAVVLLTADDVGAESSEQPSLHPRARQNVILELGYFIGKLSRQHVVVLYQSGVEIPTDYAGVEYVSLADDWKIRLGRELLAGGIPVDLNKAR